MRLKVPPGEIGNHRPQLPQDNRNMGEGWGEEPHGEIWACKAVRKVGRERNDEGKKNYEEGMVRSDGPL